MSPQNEPSEVEITSEELLRGKRSIVIRHLGEAYRLILTRNNRLILQK